MTAKTIRKLTALAFSGALTVLLIPGCEIKLRPGSGHGGDEETGPVDQSPPDIPSAPPPEEPTPEDLAAAEALAQADPQQVALATARAGYTMYLIPWEIPRLCRGGSRSLTFPGF
jgi:hypothetical protein